MQRVPEKTNPNDVMDFRQTWNDLRVETLKYSDNVKKNKNKNKRRQ